MGEKSEKIFPHQLQRISIHIRKPPPKNTQYSNYSDLLIYGTPDLKFSVTLYPNTDKMKSKPNLHTK